MSEDLLKSSIAIGQSLLAFFTATPPATRRCSGIHPLINTIAGHLRLIDETKRGSKLDMDTVALTYLDNAIAQTFYCLRDVLDITKVYDKKKANKLSFQLLDNIKAKKFELAFCNNLLLLSIQSSSNLKSQTTTSPRDQKEVMSETLRDVEARSFWMSHFDVDTCIPYATFMSKLTSSLHEAKSFDSNTTQAIQLNLDPELKSRVYFYSYVKWVQSNDTLRGAITAASTDIVVAPVVVAPPPPSYDEALAEVTAGIASTTITQPAVAVPLETKAPVAVPAPSPSPPPPAAAPVASKIDGVSDAENPPADLQLIWSDPNIDKEWNAASVDEFKKAGLKWLAFESATEVVSWFTVHPEFLRSSTLRVMSNNRIYSFEADYSTQSAALDIVTHLRKKRSMIPVLIYCGGTLPHAKTIAARLRKTIATDDYDEAMSFAKGGAISFPSPSP